MVAATPGWAAPPTVSAKLQWTAPGDDGHVGRARAYMLRYSTLPITSANFDGATMVVTASRPQPAGSRESFTVHGLTSDTRYYFALKAMDDAGNWSALSNVATFSELTAGAENLPVTLSFAAPWPNPARTSVRCAFALPRTAMVQVDAFSVDGRRVRCLASGWHPAGHREIAWDLRDEAGNRVPAGVYLVRARLDAAVWSERVAVVR
jgi:hypothetical protein